MAAAHGWPRRALNLYPSVDCIKHPVTLMRYCRKRKNHLYGPHPYPYCIKCGCVACDRAKTYWAEYRREKQVPPPHRSGDRMQYRRSTGKLVPMPKGNEK